MKKTLQQEPFNIYEIYFCISQGKDTPKHKN